MNSILLPSSSMLRLPFHHPLTHHRLQSLYFANDSCNHCHANCSLLHYPTFRFKLQRSLCTSHQSIAASLPAEEGTIPVMNFEEFAEKDWSFLDSDELNSNDKHNQKIGCIISAGGIEETSRVLVSIASEGFVDQLVETKPCNALLVVHDSLFLLAVIKEKYDKVKCWQGKLTHVPEKWAPFDVVFLYFLPALPFSLDQVFGALAKCCSPGNCECF
uniref:Uncharacterized protein MANES_08G042600 n=1 Tax=Rhizophora mucronata TaxID=61149 RepID=A0A2P2JRH4_RHIMU